MACVPRAGSRAGIALVPAAESRALSTVATSPMRVGRYTIDGECSRTAAGASSSSAGAATGPVLARAPRAGSRAGIALVPDADSRALLALEEPPALLLSGALPLRARTR